MTTKTYRKAHRYKRNKPFFKSRFFWLGFLILIFLFSVFYLLFLSKIFQVNNINVSGEQRISGESLKLSIENKLDKKILFFKTKSIFLINLTDIKKEILNEFPQTAEIVIGRRLPNSLDTIVTERQGAADWCQNEKCFLADKEGIIFEEAKGDEKSIKIIDKQRTNQPILGEKVITSDDLDKILKISPKLEMDFKIPVKEFLIYSEDKLTVFTEENWEIYFNLKNDIDWQITKLGAVLEEKIPPEQRKDLEYIELRFGNFAPFKYKD